MNWPNAQSARLFGLIQPALQALPNDLSWSLGGGTALTMWLDHRLSHDIDLFFESARALRLLSPNRNPLTKAITPKTQQPGNYLKFEVAGVGEIDILVTRDWTSTPTKKVTVGLVPMDVQTPAEILARKIAYRAPNFQLRDFFDLAATALFATQELVALRPALTGKRAVLAQRWKVLEPQIEQSVKAVTPTARGSTVVPHMRYVIGRLLGIVSKNALGSS
jgi:hypothetical protein